MFDSFSKYIEYFESLHPQADPKIVEEQAKEMIKEAKKYI